MRYKGKFKPKNPIKYKGDLKEIVYRSSWELKMMKYCDTTKSIVEWGSEEIVIPYLSPWDGRYHRYFPDFYVKVRSKNGSLKKYIIEDAIDSDCPLASASFPGKAPAVSTNDISGNLNFSANFNNL